MKIDTNDLISVSEANSRGLSKLVAEAMGGRTYVVMRSGKPAAVITGLDQLERLEQVDDMEEDVRLLTMAAVRMLTDSGNRHDLDDVAAEFGIDLDEE